MKLDPKVLNDFNKWYEAQPGSNASLQKVRLPNLPVNPFDEPPTVDLRSYLSGPVPEFETVVVIAQSDVHLLVSNLKVWQLHILSVGRVTFEHCEIGHLATEGARPEYLITECMIGHFRVKKGFSVQRLEWNGGYLGQFSLDRELDDAFVGDVWFSDDFKLRENKRNVQWLRDTRKALTARNNLAAAGIFHASELALSRHREHWSFQLASRVYEIGSNFGNSIARPALLLLAILGLLVGIALISGTTLTSPIEELKGWQKSLIDGQFLAPLLRALMYALEAVNPFSLFGGQPLVIVTDPIGATAGGCLRIAGVATVALFLLSLRRHFKLEWPKPRSLVLHCASSAARQDARPAAALNQRSVSYAAQRRGQVCDEAAADALRRQDQAVAEVAVRRDKVSTAPSAFCC